MARERVWLKTAAARWLLALAAASAMLGGQHGVALASSSVENYARAYHYSYTDFSVDEDGVHLSFRRSYGSNNPVLAAETGEFGPRWADPLSVRLLSGHDPSLVYFLDADGQLVPYHGSGGVQWHSDPGYAGGTLIHSDDGTFALTLDTGAVRIFDSNGVLIRAQDPNSAPFSVVRNADGRVQSLRAGDGVDLLTFDWESSGDWDEAGQHVAAIHDNPAANGGNPADSRTFTYSYNRFGLLTNVTNRLGETTVYSYAPEYTPLLASITDARGHVAMSLQYDPQGHVTATQDARGQITGIWRTFTRTDNGDGTSIVRVVWPPSGYAPGWQPTTEETFRLTSMLSHLKTALLPSPDATPRTFTWQAGNGAMTPLAHLDGSQTPQDIGESLETEDTPLDGANVRVGDPTQPLPTPYCGPGPAPQSLNGDPTGSHNVSAAVDPRQAPFVGAQWILHGQVTMDEFGRQVQIVDPGSGASLSTSFDAEDRPLTVRRQDNLAAVPQSWRFTYDAVGNVTDVQGPDGTVSHYTYDERDSLSTAQWPGHGTAAYSYDDRGDLLRAVFTPADGSPPQARDYAFDGLHRIRQLIVYGAWPDTSARNVYSYAYDAAENCSLVRLP